MSRVSLCCAISIVVLAGCRENSPVQPPQPGGITALLFDGSNQTGNKDFFFLPPLAPNPSGLATYDPGKFNPHLAPFVEVCELAADPRIILTTDCKSDSRVFGPARMTLDAGSEQYKLSWDTKASVLSLLGFYRIIVRGSSRGTPLGFVDVDPVFGGMKNVKTGEVFVFQDGRTLPIKVRIELGAFGSGGTGADPNDRVEQVVPNVIPAGFLDVTTNTGFAGARFPDGWLSIPGVTLDQVVVIIERIRVHNSNPGDTCLDSGLEELEGCYRFRTDPDLHTLVPGRELMFAKTVIAGVCFEIPGAAGSHEGPPFNLHRREELNGEFSGDAIKLEDTDAPFLRCDGFSATPTSLSAAFRSSGVAGMAKVGLSALARGVGRLLQPRALHAVDAGAGGSTTEFSRFGWARHATMTVTEGDGETADAGSVIQATVHLENEHHETPEPIAGQMVTFTRVGDNGALVDGEGTTSTLTVATDEFGNATVSWRLGEGENTLAVSAAQVLGSPASITATGRATAQAIGFVTDRDENTEIYVMGGDGSNPTNLTNNSAVDFQQRWSPDGSKLVFTSNRDGDAEIYVMNRDGSGVTRLTNNPADDFNPWWSPDGSKIAFESDRDENNEIYVMNADGSAQVNRSNNPGYDALPAWSPDGRRVAFQSIRGGASNPDGDSEIFIVNADGSGEPFNLTKDADFDMLPVWSPSGSEIAFQKGLGQAPFEIYVANADGSGTPTNLTNNAAQDADPQWSPDGRKIAFTSERDGNREIYVLDRATGAATRLTVNFAIDESPAWSPEGSRIAFESQRDDNDEIYVMNADGSGLTNLTNNGANDQRPRWSPVTPAPIP